MTRRVRPRPVLTPAASGDPGRAGAEPLEDELRVGIARGLGDDGCRKTCEECCSQTDQLPIIIVQRNENDAFATRSTRLQSLQVVGMGFGERIQYLACETRRPKQAERTSYRGLEGGTGNAAFFAVGLAGAEGNIEVGQRDATFASCDMERQRPGDVGDPRQHSTRQQWSDRGQQAQQQCFDALAEPGPFLARLWLSCRCSSHEKLSFGSERGFVQWKLEGLEDQMCLLVRCAKRHDRNTIEILRQAQDD